jgi:hypothetical protein
VQVSRGPHLFVPQSSFLPVAMKFTIQQWMFIVESFIWKKKTIDYRKSIRRFIRKFPEL